MAESALSVVKPFSHPYVRFSRCIRHIIGSFSVTELSGKPSPFSLPYPPPDTEDSTPYVS